MDAFQLVMKQPAIPRCCGSNRNPAHQLRPRSQAAGLSAGRTGGCGRAALGYHGRWGAIIRQIAPVCPLSCPVWSFSLAGHGSNVEVKVLSRRRGLRALGLPVPGPA